VTWPSPRLLQFDPASRCFFDSSECEKEQRSAVFVRTFQAEPAEPTIARFALPRRAGARSECRINSRPATSGSSVPGRSQDARSRCKKAAGEPGRRTGRRSDRSNAASDSDPEHLQRLVFQTESTESSRSPDLGSAVAARGGVTPFNVRAEASNLRRSRFLLGIWRHEDSEWPPTRLVANRSYRVRIGTAPFRRGSSQRSVTAELREPLVGAPPFVIELGLSCLETAHSAQPRSFHPPRRIGCSRS